MEARVMMDPPFPRESACVAALAI